MGRRKIVIFDMDGTLLDSSTDITLTINYIRKTRGLEPVDKESIVKAINTPGVNLSEVFYGMKTYEKRERDLFESHYWDQCVQNLTIYPEVPELLESLREKGIHLSVATNAASIFAKKMLKTTGLTPFFDQILGSCDVKNTKPHPEIIYKILRRYNYSSEHFDLPVIVGDSHKDMEAAKEAKINAIYVKWGFKNDDIPGAFSAHAPKEVLSLLERL